MKLFFASLIAAAVMFGGCSSKEINETTEDIGKDIGNFVDKVTEQR